MLEHLHVVVEVQALAVRLPAATGAFRGWLFPASHSVAALGVLAVVLFVIAGMLFVIPTAAEIPIIQGLLLVGFPSRRSGSEPEDDPPRLPALPQWDSPSVGIGPPQALPVFKLHVSAQSRPFRKRSANTLAIKVFSK
jgi:hypothetical protein